MNATSTLAENRRSVLIVDDMPDLRAVLREVLESSGFDVEEAEDGVAALDLAQRSEPDVILMDWMMPRMSGKEFLNALDDRRLASRVVVISAMDVKAPGAAAVLRKPFDCAQMLSVVESVASGAA